MGSQDKTLEQIFDLADQDLKCNTSYPILPEAFAGYRSNVDIMAGVDALSLYFHIPFCKNICSFCEYTRFKAGNEKTESGYLDMLNDQTKRFIIEHPIALLYGLDVGGGTPTALSEYNFARLMELIEKTKADIPQVSDFESSIEFSFSTISEAKIRAMREAGFTRASAGLQVFDAEILKKNRRAMADFETMLYTMDLLKQYGISKRNLDLMYGLPNQTLEKCEKTVRVLEQIMPEHITLYETRYNMNTIKNEQLTRQSLYEQYSYFYNALTSLGYKAVFGQNTFTLCDDEGVSSYLKYRMHSGIPYKGLGISAQSMSCKGISYNILKNSRESEMPAVPQISEQDIYLLPAEEVIAKYVCISLYSGRIYLDFIFKMAQNDEMKKRYSAILSFLQERKYVYVQQNACYLTETGFLHYGAIAALFWSKHHQEYYWRTIR